MTTLVDSAAPSTPALRPHRIPADGLYEGQRTLRRTPDGWDDRPYERFEAVPQAATIGAEIRGLDLSRPLYDGLRAELNRALLEWKVLFFRGQHLSSGAQREFARNWGELESNPLLARGDSKDVVRFDKAVGGVTTFENVWHTDVTFRERPALGAVLQLREVPPSGRRHDVGRYGGGIRQFASGNPGTDRRGAGGARLSPGFRALLLRGSTGAISGGVPSG